MTVKVFLGKNTIANKICIQDYIAKTFPGRRVYDTDKVSANALHGFKDSDGSYTQGLIRNDDIVLYIDYRFNDLLRDIIKNKMAGEYLRVNMAYTGVRKVPIKCDIVIFTYPKKSTKEMLEKLGITEFEVIKNV